MPKRESLVSLLSSFAESSGLNSFYALESVIRQLDKLQASQWSLAVGVNR